MTGKTPTVGQDALRMLGVRPLTERELEQRLLRRGHPAAAVEAELARLRRAGHLDDEALARHYIVTRSERLGHGGPRLLRELEGRGVPAAVARRAWQAALDAGEVDAEELLQRAASRRAARLGGALDRRDWRRVYNALLRAGFEPHRVVDALKPYRRFDDQDPQDPQDDEADHEFA